MHSNLLSVRQPVYHGEKMKFVLALLLSIVLLTACSDRDLSTRILKPGGTGSPGGGEKPTYSGKVANFNGTWAGKGSASFKAQKYENLEFRLMISEIPMRLTLKLDMVSNGSQFFAMELGAFSIVDNTLRDPKSKSNVGSIGAMGFITTGSKIVEIEAKVDKSKVMIVSGFYVGDGGKLEFSGEVKNSQF